MKTGERINGEDLLGKTLEVCEGGMFKIVEDKFPQVGSTYWFVRPLGQVDCYRWDGEEMDLFLAKYNRIFPNEKLAKEYATYLKEKAELSFEPDWKNREEIKYYFAYNYENDGWYIGGARVAIIGNQMYFPSDQCMRELVEKTGYEKFLYFEFGVPMKFD